MAQIGRRISGQVFWGFSLGSDSSAMHSAMLIAAVRKPRTVAAVFQWTYEEDTRRRNLQMSEQDRSSDERDSSLYNIGSQKHAQTHHGKAWAPLRDALSYVKRGILFYWYTGQRRIAITGAAATTILYLVCLWLLGAKGLIALVFLLMMDHLLIIFMVLYMIAIRPLFPAFLIGELDAFMASYWLVVLVGWVGNRVITNAIALRIFGFNIHR